MNTNLGDRSSFRQGFTTLELLVAMGILGIILLYSGQFVIDSSKATTMLSDQTTLQEDLRIAGSIITDEVQRALYVFPPCGEYGTSVVDNTMTTLAPSFNTDCLPPGTAGKVAVNWSRFKMAAGGNTTKNPKPASASAPYIWQVGYATGSAPILAMIVSPRDPSVQCRTGTGTNDFNPNGCYQFVTYYPIKRSQLTQSAASFSAPDPTTGTITTFPGDLESSGQLEPDSSNNETWVLMEFRRNLDTNISGNMSGIPTISPWGNAGCKITTTTSGGVTTTTNTCLTISSQTATPPSTESGDTVQGNQLGSIPVLRRSTPGDQVSSSTIASFQRRMLQTKEWLEKFWVSGTPGSGKILLDGLRKDTGFQVEFPSGSIDERGVTEVRLKLQAGINRQGKEVLVPGTGPLEFFIAPRNISTQ